MSYQSWWKAHSIKHKKIVDKLVAQGFDDMQIIDYFDYDNMKEKETDFCVLYGKNQKCHDMKDLNCYLCACPNFRVTTSRSFCNINSKDGSSIVRPEFTHQDCSNCTVPHQKSFVEKCFDKDWTNIMSDTFK